MPSYWKLLLAVTMPVALASPVRPRLEQNFGPWPTPTNTFVIPGFPIGGSLVPDPVYPGGPIVPDPAHPGGALKPDPVYPGGPIIADPGSPGGSLTPDPTYPGGPVNPDDGYGDENALGARDKAEKADYPPPSFGFGSPAFPTIITPGTYPTGGHLRPGRAVNNAAQAPAPTAAPDCTYTLAAAPLGTAKACAWNGIETIYPSTVTVVHGVACNGCGHLHIDQQAFACPNMVISASTTVATARTVYQTVCAASSVVSDGTSAV